MDGFKRMQDAIRQQNYRISAHANDEMADDFLLAVDVENIILTGKIAQKFTKDARGRRYTVLGINTVPGITTDDRPAYVVCRFLLSGVLLIVTAYVAEEER